MFKWVIIMYPKIGIISREEKKFKQTYKTFNSEILDVISTYHGVPVGIIVDFNNDSDLEFERIVQIIDFCDGIILQGGSNFYDIDQKIVKYLYEKNIPTLGICLGMQQMGVTMDGELKLLPNDNHQKKDYYVHSININNNSLLYHILKEDKIRVNSRHSEYLTKTDLSIGAFSSDKIIEEVEDINKTFFLGVGWHPESIQSDLNSIKLFRYFFSSIKKSQL